MCKCLCAINCADCALGKKNKNKNYTAANIATFCGTVLSIYQPFSNQHIATSLAQNQFTAEFTNINVN